MKKQDLLNYLNDFTARNGLRMYNGKHFNWGLVKQDVPNYIYYLYVTIPESKHPDTHGPLHSFIYRDKCLHVKHMVFKCSLIGAEKIIMSFVKGTGMEIPPMFQKGNEDKLIKIWP